MRCPACGFENLSNVSHCERCEARLAEALPTVQLKYHVFADCLWDFYYRLNRFFDPYLPAYEDVEIVDGKIVTRESVRYLINPENPNHPLKDNPWISMALSIIPGLGHIYLGKRIRGLIFFLIYLIFVCLYIFSPVAFLSDLSYALLISVHLMAIVDAAGAISFLTNQKLWIRILLVILLYFLLSSLLYVPLRDRYFSVVRPSQVSSYYEEAQGGRPLRFYRPLPQQRSSLERGQIVIYRMPGHRLEQPTIVVREAPQAMERIIGLAGDEIAFKEERIFINGNELDRSLYPLSGDKIYPPRDFQLVVPEGRYFIFPARVIQQTVERGRGMKPQALAQLVRDVSLIPYSQISKVCWNR